jgi:broad specificity phosphatase PhoE
MQRLFIILVVSGFLTGCSNTYYIVRHAEKAAPSSGTTMITTNDPPLSRQGELRAKSLGELLKHKNISYIFSTNTIRTMSTAAPVAAAFNITPEHYASVDQHLINRLKGIKKNTLVVGHSNTVDDIVNMLTGETRLSDLPDSAYNNIYVVRRKGKRFVLKPADYDSFRSK